MKLWITYDETVTFRQRVEVDDEDYERWLDGALSTPEQMRAYLTHSPDWEMDLHDGKTARDTEVLDAAIDIYKVEVDTS